MRELVRGEMKLDGVERRRRNWGVGEVERGEGGMLSGKVG